MKRNHENSLIMTCIKELFEIYMDNHVARSAAELSYYLTLSIFPTLICIHAAIVNFVPGLTLTLSSLSGIVPEETLTTITDYLNYVAAHSSKTLLTAGIIGMATTSAASFRSIHSIMGEIQGVSRYRGVFALFFSFVFSVIFLASIYFGALVLVTGSRLFNLLGSAFPIFEELELWRLLRFPLMFVVFVLIIYGIYRITAPRDAHDTFFHGAFTAAVVLVMVSVLFSWFIGISTKYPLIYGSLASIIIFMLWIYFCGQVLIMGNALNVVLRRHAPPKKEKKRDNDQQPVSESAVLFVLAP